MFLVVRCVICYKYEMRFTSLQIAPFKLTHLGVLDQSCVCQLEWFNLYMEIHNTLMMLLKIDICSNNMI